MHKSTYIITLIEFLFCKTIYNFRLHPGEAANPLHLTLTNANIPFIIISYF